MTRKPSERRYEVVDFAQLAPQECPCGHARRALMDAADVPLSIHRTEISSEARVHYHRRLTESYYILECDADARMELDGELVAIRPGQLVLIRPGVRHRAVGRMQVLVVVSPKFDPTDEWFDDGAGELVLEGGFAVQNGPGASPQNHRQPSS